MYLVNLCWVSGHANLTPNELADKAAKEAAEISRNLGPPESKSVCNHR